MAHPVPGLYGADRMMLSAMTALRDNGHAVTFVVPESGPLLPVAERAGITARLVAFPVLRKALLRPVGLFLLTATSPWHIARLVLLIKRAAPDLVYVNTITLPHWLIAARVAGVPAICHVREAEEHLPGAVARGLLAPLRLASVVIANSTATASWVSRHQPKLTSRLRVVYNGFDLAPEPPPPSVTSGTRRRITVVGRLSPRKGQDVALAAVASLVQAGRDVELRFVGDVFRGYEWFETQLRADIRRLGLQDVAFIDGFSSDPSASYADADVVVVPSRIEPFGNVAVEAMAAGRPVIATRVGGLPEILDHERTGLLCDPDDAAALTAAITRLLDDEALAQRLAVTGAAEVRDRFGMTRFRGDLLAAVEAATKVER